MSSWRKALERVVFFLHRVVLVGVAKSRPSFRLDAEVDVAAVMAYFGLGPEMPILTRVTFWWRGAGSVGVGLILGARRRCRCWTCIRR